MARARAESTPAMPPADGRGVIDLTRRELLSMALTTGAAALLGGCAGSKGPNMVGQPIPQARTYPRTGTAPGSTFDTLPPGVIPRRSWTTTMPVPALANPMGRVDRITIHHDAINSADVTSRTAAQRRLNTIRSGHLEREFADIGYHFIVDPQGNIWEGRPLRYQGAHVKDQNERNMGVMVMGNFMEQAPTPAALAALDAFVASQMQRFGIPLGRVKTHQELAATACPGVSLQRYMVKTRSGSGRMARA
jgi:hypothetical protein